MTALLAVEVRRYLVRRVVWVMVGLTMAGMALAGTITFIKSQRVEPAVAKARFEQAQAQHDAALRECLRSEFIEPPNGLSKEEFCARAVGEVQVGGLGFRLTDLRGVYIGTNIVLMALFVVLTASFIGAEWHAGTMTTLLTWEPRRLRVFVAKAGVACAMAFAGLIALQAVLGLALLPAALVKGSTLGVDAEWLRSVLGLLARGGAVAAIASALVASVAFVGRNTAAALGVAFGYIGILEPILRAVRPGWQRFLFFDNAAVLMLGDQADLSVLVRSVAAAGTLLALYALVALTVAGVAFVRRDVT